MLFAFVLRGLRSSKCPQCSADVSALMTQCNECKILCGEKGETSWEGQHSTDKVLHTVNVFSCWFWSWFVFPALSLLCSSYCQCWVKCPSWKTIRICSPLLMPVSRSWTLNIADFISSYCSFLKINVVSSSCYSCYTKVSSNILSVLRFWTKQRVHNKSNVTLYTLMCLYLSKASLVRLCSDHQGPLLFDSSREREMNQRCLEAEQKYQEERRRIVNLDLQLEKTNLDSK